MRVIDCFIVFFGLFFVIVFFDYNFEINKIYCIVFIILLCSIKFKFFYWKFLLKIKINNIIKIWDVFN